MPITDLATEFPLDGELIYLNHAGVSPWSVRTVAAVNSFAAENCHSGSLRYSDWLQLESGLRRRLATLLNAPSADDIALLKSTSEALSVVAYGLQWQQHENVVISNQEFPSNRIVWESLAKYGVQVKAVDLYEAESPEDALFAACDAKTRVIAISAVQYASGLKMDLERIGRFCRSNGILFCIDAIQQIGALPLDVQACQADFVMADGHKWMLGPEGLTVFYCRMELRPTLSLNQYGWHMVEDHGNFERLDWEPASSSRRFECGSSNMLAIHALSASLSLLEELGMDEVSRLVINNALYLIDIIRNTQDLKVYSPEKPGRLAGIVTFRHTKVEGIKLYRYLADNGVICALRAGGIRFSPHFYTPRKKLDEAMELVLGYG